jgi:hypothetical protein
VGWIWYGKVVNSKVTEGMLDEAVVVYSHTLFKIAWFIIITTASVMFRVWYLILYISYNEILCVCSM